MSSDSQQRKRKASRKLYRYIYGNWFTMITRTYAQLDIATLLSETALTSTELADKTQTDHAALKIFLRGAEDMGFHQIDPETKKLVLTEIGTLLSRNSPNNLRAAALLNGADYRYQPWGQLPEYLATGSGEGISPTWEDGSLPFLADKPEQLAIFQQAMRDLSHSTVSGQNENEAIAELIDFSRFPSIIDIGGGTGALLSAIHHRHPNCDLSLYDLQESLVTDEKSTDCSPEIKRIAGNFFDEIPSGYSGYLIKNILHNHPEERLDPFLQNLSRALHQSPGSRAFLFELLRADERPGRGRNSLIDLNLNLLVGGRVRSLPEYRQLLARYRLGIKSTQTLPHSTRHAMEIEPILH